MGDEESEAWSHRGQEKLRSSSRRSSGREFPASTVYRYWTPVASGCCGRLYSLGCSELGLLEQRSLSVFFCSNLNWYFISEQPVVCLVHQTRQGGQYLGLVAAT